MIYITGDTHGDFSRIKRFCRKHNTSREDTLIILGDVGLNYYGDIKDVIAKEWVETFPITFFCIHGNHERRVETLDGYDLQLKYGGLVYFQPEYPNILFAKDGEVYDFDGVSAIALGGAYSVDKFYRLTQGYHWFEDEQPSDEIKEFAVKNLSNENWKIDCVLSHTCPFKYLPREVFLPMIDQSTVDQTTEKWLGEIEEKLDYKKWYCGHYHTSKKIDKVQFMFNDIEEFIVKGDEENVSNMESF